MNERLHFLRKMIFELAGLDFPTPLFIHQWTIFGNVDFGFGYVLVFSAITVIVILGIKLLRKAIIRRKKSQ